MTHSKRRLHQLLDPLVAALLLCNLWVGSAFLSKQAPPVVVLPGFGNDAMDYMNPLGRGDDLGLVSALKRRGLHAYVVPVQRQEWAQVFLRGARNAQFWAGNAAPDVAFDWYLGKVQKTVSAVVESSGAEDVLLVGHSAGGWLGRCALAGEGGDRSPRKKALPVSTLVTLGSPHMVGEAAEDQTRGAVRWVNENLPGSYHEDVNYVTVAGTAVMGDSSAPRKTLERYAAGSYGMLLGSDGDQVVGDGVVPLDVAHIDGSTRINLEGCFHSINAPENKWYGGEAFMDAWLEPALSTLPPRWLTSFADIPRPLLAFLASDRSESTP